MVVNSTDILRAPPRAESVEQNASERISYNANGRRFQAVVYRTYVHEADSDPEDEIVRMLAVGKRPLRLFAPSVLGPLKSFWNEAQTSMRD